MSTVTTHDGPRAQADLHPLARLLVEFLETGTPPRGLFAPEVFCDFTLPHWRLQAEGVDDLVALRRQGHPGPGTVPRWRCDRTSRGFVLEFEERWEQDGQRWYARELVRADVVDDAIVSLSVYCTGDWDEARQRDHAEQVRLIRP
jgi:hypothetical protein